MPVTAEMDLMVLQVQVQQMAVPEVLQVQELQVVMVEQDG